MLPTPETRVQVVPVEAYRSQPASVEARLVETDINAGEQLPRSWQPIAASNAVGASVTDAPIGWTQIDDDLNNGNRLVHRVGPIYLAQPIVTFLEDHVAKLADRLRGNRDSKLNVVLSTNEPLQVASMEGLLGGVPNHAVSENLQGTVAARFRHLTETLDEPADPYGWYVAESLGLSCECKIIDERGEPVSLQNLL
ncbi:unnamed protein product, partial [Hapterophycus canaliculatus]